MITQERLLEIFAYDEDTGIVTTKVSRKYDQEVGTPVGSLTANGYLYVKVDGTSYQLHRLIFLMLYGYMPEYVDHKDTVKTNNSKVNLREATRNQNRANLGAYSSNKLSLKGVQFDERQQRAIGQVKVDNIRYWKSFRVTANRTKEQAIAKAFLYVLDIREKVHGEFVNHGFTVGETAETTLEAILAGEYK